MNLASQRDTLLAKVKDALADYLPDRVVDRGLVDPATQPLKQLQAGVLRLVATGGGNFANYQGREGELGTVRFRILGLVQVPEKSEKVQVEQAEMALLEDVLRWIGVAGLPKLPPLDSLYPGDYTQSGGLEHPVGWFLLNMEARNV